MAADRSFTDYVKDKFFNTIYKAVEDFVEHNWERLDLDISNVHSVGEVSMPNMEIQFVLVGDLSELNIEFDVVVDAEIEVSEGDYHYDDYDLCNQWFLLNCKGNLENSLDDFQIMGIEVYTQRNKIEKPLSDALVPYIDVRDNRDITNEAMIKLRQFYTTIPRKYPRVKALFYWSKIDTNLGYFDLTKNQGILNVYKDVIQDPYYISHMSETSPIYYENIGNVELNNGVEKISSFMKNYEPNINKVQYFIDGNQIGEATKRPFEITYDFSKLNKNNAKFKVVAYKDDKLLIQREMDIKKGNTSINNEKDVEIYLNNNKLNLENKAIIKDGRTYIPVRKLVETSGGNINWDDTDKSFIIIKNGKSIKMSIGSKKAYVNGELVEIDAEPFIYENYSYLPIRIICEEVLEYKVDWNEKERKVILE